MQYPSWPNLVVAAIVAGTLLGQARPARADDWRVLEGGADQLLHEQLLETVAAQYAARRVEVTRAQSSAEAMIARRQLLRSQFRKLLGDLPERTPLDARTVGIVEGDDYRIERVIFQSRPHHHVTANLYLPKVRTGRVPGVLVPCGHADNGKASGPYQSVCILLARHGCAALIYDPIGQGERNQLRELERHGTTEHTLVGAGALLVGWNTANYRVWDGLRAMDYLASRDEVDPSRLGCTGNSGGGTMTTWLMALDERIVAAAPSCFITTVERLFSTIGPQDCEQHFPAQGALGIEHTDFITMRAPQPTLIVAADQDFFDIRGTREAYGQAKAVYTVLGQPERVGFFSYNDKHGFSQPRREAAVAWMRRWLADDDQPIHEAEPILRTNAELQVTERGQVIDEFPDETTVVELAMAEARRLSEGRKAGWQKMSIEDRVQRVRKALNLLPSPVDASTIRQVSSESRETFFAAKIVIERRGRVTMPAAVCAPVGDRGQRDKRPGVIYADSAGKTRGLEGGAVERLVLEGKIVLAVDLPGYGETADSPKEAKYFNDEFRTAMLAMHVGRPLVTERVDGLLAAFDALAKYPGVDPKQIELIAVDAAGPAALHAAVLEPKIAGVRLLGSIRSWADDVVAKPLVPGQLSQVVPGALVHYDLTDLAEMLGNRVKFESAPLSPMEKLGGSTPNCDPARTCR